MSRRYGTTGIYASLEFPKDEPEFHSVTESTATASAEGISILSSVRELVPQVRDRWESAWFASLMEPTAVPE